MYISTLQETNTMMEATRTSETSFDIYLTTRQYIPEDSDLHTRRRENLNSHVVHIVYHRGVT
jgi:hypothetical protein